MGNSMHWSLELYLLIFYLTQSVLQKDSHYEILLVSKHIPPLDSSSQFKLPCSKSSELKQSSGIIYATRNNNERRKNDNLPTVV